MEGGVGAHQRVVNFYGMGPRANARNLQQGGVEPNFQLLTRKFNDDVMNKIKFVSVT